MYTCVQTQRWCITTTMHIVHKKRGETPLQCIQRLFDTTTNTYTYAGRLDPMAEGLLLILENEECKQAKHYHKLNKTYEYAFITGISTDTYDCLGKITETNYPKQNKRKEIETVINELTGTQTLPYPPYASKTVNNTPLFVYARNNTVHTITVPTNTVHITEHTLTKTRQTTLHSIKRDIIPDIQQVTGDFRQNEILDAWKNLPNQKVQYYAATISASSGTYIRAIVHEIGRRSKCPTVTVRIKRTKIGRWTKPGVKE